MQFIKTKENNIGLMKEKLLIKIQKDFTDVKNDLTAYPTVNEKVEPPKQNYFDLKNIGNYKDMKYSPG